MSKSRIISFATGPRLVLILRLAFLLDVVSSQSTVSTQNACWLGDCESNVDPLQIEQAIDEIYPMICQQHDYNLILVSDNVDRRSRGRLILDTQDRLRNMRRRLEEQKEEMLRLQAGCVANRRMEDENLTISCGPPPTLQPQGWLSSKYV